jgi:hypothetical protein
MGVMQVVVNQVIDVVPVWYRLVAAVRTVNMLLIMPGALVIGRAFLRVDRAYFDVVVIHVVAVGMMQVAIVKIVGVAIMFHSHMATVRAMVMIVGA